MARRIIEVPIIADNRDAGKTFIITEMSATKGEEWAIRAMGAISRSGFDLDQDAINGGMMVMVALGFRAFLKGDWDLIKPLLQEMFTCVQIKVDKAPQGRPLVESDIEEISTRVKLRDEVFDLHAGFSIAAVLKNLTVAKPEMTDDLQSMQTSTLESES